MKKKECYPSFFSGIIKDIEAGIFNNFIESLDFQNGFQMENKNGNIIIICFSGSSYNQMCKALSESNFSYFTTSPINEMAWE